MIKHNDQWIGLWTEMGAMFRGYHTSYTLNKKKTFVDFEGAFQPPQKAIFFFVSPQLSIF